MLLCFLFLFMSLALLTERCLLSVVHGYQDFSAPTFPCSFAAAKWDVPRGMRKPAAEIIMAKSYRNYCFDHVLMAAVRMKQLYLAAIPCSLTALHLVIRERIIESKAGLSSISLLLHSPRLPGGAFQKTSSKMTRLLAAKKKRASRLCCC